MGDSLSSSHAGADTLDEGVKRTTAETAPYHCPVCGIQRPATDIRYDQLGYPICPACSYAAGP